MSQYVSNTAVFFTLAAEGASFTLWVRPLAGPSIPVETTRKRVKHLNLRVDRTGTVHLSIPQRTSRAAAQAFIDSKAAWIGIQVEQAGLRAAGEPAPCGPVPSTVPLWGSLVPVHDVPALKDLAIAPALDLAQLPEGTPGAAETGARSGTCPGKQGGTRSEAFRQRLDAFYRSEVSAALPAIISRREAAAGVHAAGWQVRTMTSRWGSCTPKAGTIRINGALAAYPPECLEYVVAHELVHLLEPSHNERFHAILDKTYPQNQAARALLRRSAREIAQPA